MEQRVYGPVPWNIRYSLCDWLSKQSTVDNYHLFVPIIPKVEKDPEHIRVVFTETANSQDKARIGRTLAWSKLRRQKHLEGVFL